MNLFDLLLPSNCIYCGAEPNLLCDRCRPALGENLKAVTRGDLHGYCLIEYDELGRQLMHAFKASGMFALGRLLANRLAEQQHRPAADLLVAAPSSKQANRARGYAPAKVIAETLGRRWSISTIEARLGREVADQAGLTGDQRRKNLAGAFVLGRSLAGKSVWLVDDIVTTGSTLVELASACRAAGATVLGFSAIAQSSLKTVTQS